MNDRWTDAAYGIVEDALADLLAVQERLAALLTHSPTRAPLAIRAGDLEHRIAAASGVLAAYGVAGAPGECADQGDGIGAPPPSPAPAREAA